MADYPDPPIRQEAAPAKPAWAYFMQDADYVPGYDLRPGDTIFLSKTAYPRVLWTQLSQSSWSVLVQKPYIHVRGQISIEPGQYYVVKRATRR